MTPSDVEAYIISSLLTRSDHEAAALLDEYRQRLRDDWFLEPSNRAIWQSACALRDRGAHINKENINLDPRVDRLYLLALSGEYRLVDQELWCMELFAHYKRWQTLALTAAPRDDPEALLASLQEITNQGDLLGLGATTISHCVESALESLSSPSRGLSTGIPALDGMSYGLLPGELIVLAAATGVGKTSLALNMLVHAAVMEKAHCLVLSYEMTRRELTLRMLSSLADVPLSSIRSRSMTAVQWKRLERASKALESSSIEIDDSGSLSASEAASRLRSAKPDLMLVDYLQIMPCRGRHENRNLEIGAATRELKLASLASQVPVLLLSQLSRDVGKRADKRPQLSDLRDSGSVEQDSDKVLMLYRHEYYEPNDESEKGMAELLVRKHRNGATGDIRMAWVAETTTFCELGAMA